jgi:hypothetical protein
LSPPSIDSQNIRDERWAIKTFRPLLKRLDVQNIPDELIKRLKEILRSKTHALLYEDIVNLVLELKRASSKMKYRKNSEETARFPDEHFRLGFEDFPSSYPIMFEEFLMSEELFEEYFFPEQIECCCKAVARRDKNEIIKYIISPCKILAEKKALDSDFVISRVLTFLTPRFMEYIRQERIDWK